MSRTKFTLIILGTILIMGLFGWIGYVYFSNKNATDNTALTVRDFFPFGRPSPAAPVTEPGNTIGQPTQTDTTGPYVPPRLRKITTFAVAGFIPLTKERELPPVIDPLTGLPKPLKPKEKPKTETIPLVRFTARSNGNVYEVGSDSQEQTTVSSTYIPKIYEALFGGRGDNVIFRYLDENNNVQSYLATVPKRDSTIKDLVGTFLPENILNISISPDTTKYFYLFKTGETTSGIVGTFGATPKTQVFSHAFSEWTSAWIDAKKILFTTKPSSGISGFAYTLDTQTKLFSKILGDKKGLIILPNKDGKQMLFSESGVGSIVAKILTLTPRGEQQLGIRTFAEKCVWGKDPIIMYCAIPKSIPSVPLPDSWYQGVISFDDNLWRVNTQTGIYELLADPMKDSSEEIDVTNMALDDTESLLYFINKKDATLWSLNIK